MGCLVKAVREHNENKKQVFKQARKLANESGKGVFVIYDRESKKYVTGFDTPSGRLVSVGLVKPTSECFGSQNQLWSLNSRRKVCILRSASQYVVK